MMRPTLMEMYKQNEARNYHTENYLMLAEAFGTPKEVTKVKDILIRNEKNGYTSDEDEAWMFKNINRYYKTLREKK